MGWDKYANNDNGIDEIREVDDISEKPDGKGDDLFAEADGGK